MNSRGRINGTARVRPNTPPDSRHSKIYENAWRAPQLHLEIRSELDECKRVQNEILARAVDCGFAESEIFGIHLALEEALVNAVKHGNESDPSKKITVDYAVSDCGVHVRITDEGLGFDPQRVPDPTLPEGIERPSGRGILLIRHYMTAVRFNERGNSLEMWKRRAESAESIPQESTLPNLEARRTRRQIMSVAPEIASPLLETASNLAART